MKIRRKKSGRFASLGPHLPALLVAGLFAVLIGYLVVLVLTEWVAAPLILKAVNKNLNKNPEYRNRAGSLDIHLLRGGYTLKDLVIARKRGDTVLPVFTAKSIRVTLRWSALLRGRGVGEAVLREPRLNLIEQFLEPKPGAPPGAWKKTLDPFFPFPIDRLTVRDGSLHYQDFARIPPVDVFLDRLDGEAKGLAALRAASRERPASLRISARAMGHAPLRLDMRMIPESRYPVFDLDARLENLRLASLNPFFRARAELDVERGSFGFSTRLAAADGRFTGSVRPRTRDLKILEPEKDDRKFLRLAWETLADAAGKRVEKNSRSKADREIPVSGSFAPGAEFWSTLGSLLRGTFVRALDPRLGKALRFGDGIRWDSPEDAEKKAGKKIEKKSDSPD